MKGDAQPNRQSIRKSRWDYTSGCYFVTINARKGRPLFGAVVNGRMVLNDAGKIVADCWRQIPAHFPGVTLDEFVVMPNHVHGVLWQGFGMPNPCGEQPGAISMCWRIVTGWWSGT
jgi:hypothetical protein